MSITYDGFDGLVEIGAAHEELSPAVRVKLLGEKGSAIGNIRINEARHLAAILKTMADEAEARERTP